MGRRREEIIEREVEREQGSPDERRFLGESVDDIAADEVVSERLGGVPGGALPVDPRPFEDPER